jgi:hypothetical protein
MYPAGAGFLAAAWEEMPVGIEGNLGAGVAQDHDGPDWKQ